MHKEENLRKREKKYPNKEWFMMKVKVDLT